MSILKGKTSSAGTSVVEEESKEPLSPNSPQKSKKGGASADKKNTINIEEEKKAEPYVEEQMPSSDEDLDAMSPEEWVYMV